MISAMPPPHPATGVTAVVVTHHPDAAALQRALAALLPQVDAVIVVDNGSAEPPAPGPGVAVIRLARNQGIAAAQNQGLRAALAAGCEQLLLLDQDSVPQPGMVAALQAALQAAAARGERVAAAGPLVLDPNGRGEGFLRYRGGRHEFVAPSAAGPAIDCDLLIASGMLIPATALRAVGEMAEGLFVDKVDTEWCLRATAAGFALLGVPSARLAHRIGDAPLRLWFFGWRQVTRHRPFRYYYMWRNSLLLRRLPHAGRRWRQADARQLASLLLYFGLLARGRGEALGMMLQGLRDGLRGRTGPRP